MINGVFHADDPGPDTTQGGAFKRAAATIRNTLPAGPWAEGRFHLYAAWNCPWAHRVLLVRAIKGLAPWITVAYARPRRTDQGWVYDPDGAFGDVLFGVDALHQAYARATPAYTGRLTVPLLWDRDTDSPVSNESADLVRMLNAGETGPDLYPADLAEQIDAWNALIYPTLNNGLAISHSHHFATGVSTLKVRAGGAFLVQERMENPRQQEQQHCGQGQ